MDTIYLMYHDIVSKEDKSSGFQNESAFQYKVEEDRFEEQVRALDGEDVVFTFDDGGESFLSKAMPILEKYGRKGIFFIATDYIGTSGFLTKEQVLLIKQRGHIIGSHSSSHPHNMAGLDKGQIANEWIHSVNLLSEIVGGTVTIASLPNGNSSKTIMDGVTMAGLKELYTSEPTTGKRKEKGVTKIGRFVVHSSMTTDDVLKIVKSSSYRRALHAKWMLLSAIKSVLGGNYKKIKSLFI